MIFTIDRHSVTEGDIVEVRWNCQGAQDVKLTLDNGFKATSIPLELEGTKKFRLNRSNGLTCLTITTIVEGKVFHKKLRVRVKKLKAVKAETIDDRGRSLGPLRRFWQNVVTKCSNFKAKFRLAFRQMPAQKQLATKALFIIMLVTLLAIFFPKIYSFGLLVVALYLCWVIIKR